MELTIDIASAALNGSVKRKQFGQVVLCIDQLWLLNYQRSDIKHKIFSLYYFHLILWTDGCILSQPYEVCERIIVLARKVITINLYAATT